MNEQELKKCILSGEFCRAAEILKPLSEEEITKLVIRIGYETVNLNVYTLILYILLFEQKAFWHFLIANLFLVSLCDMEGAYYLGLFHLRRAIEFEPNNIAYKQFLIAFHNTPDVVVSQNEAILIAHEILRVDPNNQSANDIIKQN